MLLLRIVVFFILEATVTSYGLLAIHEVVAMLFGSMMLIKTDVEFLQNERRSWISVTGTALGFMSSSFASEARREM